MTRKIFYQITVLLFMAIGVGFMGLSWAVDGEDDDSVLRPISKTAGDVATLQAGAQEGRKKLAALEETLQETAASVQAKMENWKREQMQLTEELMTLDEGATSETTSSVEESGAQEPLGTSESRGVDFQNQDSEEKTASLVSAGEMVDEQPSASENVAGKQLKDPLTASQLRRDSKSIIETLPKKSVITNVSASKLASSRQAPSREPQLEKAADEEIFERWKQEDSLLKK